MLFDLQGKRRRVVQGTYLLLAVLMGGGLVLFGVGGDIQGGLFNAFDGSGDSNSNNGNSLIAKRVDANEKKAKANPRDAAVRKALTRDYYSLATSSTSDANASFSADAKADLRKSSANWKAYVGLTAKPDPSLARVALQVYDPNALNKPDDAKEAARVIAQEENDANAYLNLVQYAALAKDTRLRDLAADKALDLTPAADRKQVRAQLKTLKNPQAAQSAQGSTGTQGAVPQQ